MLAQLAPDPPTIRLSGLTAYGSGKTPRFGTASAEPRNAYLGLTSVPIPSAWQDPNGQIAARQQAREQATG